MMKSISELMDLSGRVVLISGGAGYIGQAIADAVAELGASVAVADLSETSCIDITTRIANKYGVPVAAFAVDLADEEQTLSLPAATVNKLGRLDVLINCAGFVGTTDLKGWTVPFEEQTAATWRMAMEVNLTSVFNLSQASAPFLKASGHGSIINISSIYGVYAPDMRLYDGLDMGNPAAYAASKGGLIQFTRWCSTVLAPNIRVNVITPGGVFRNQNEKFVERYIERTPLRRMAAEEDFKGAACFLASDLSAYMTGQNMIIDGGWGIW